MEINFKSFALVTAALKVASLRSETLRLFFLSQFKARDTLTSVGSIVEAECGCYLRLIAKLADNCHVVPIDNASESVMEAESYV